MRNRILLKETNKYWPLLCPKTGHPMNYCSKGWSCPKCGYKVNWCT